MATVRSDLHEELDRLGRVTRHHDAAFGCVQMRLDALEGALQALIARVALLEGASPAPRAPASPAPAPAPALDSRILPALPDILAEFRGQTARLLWRASEHDFRGEAFHRYCDGRANTLTLVQDADGSVFGGFTPVEWETRTGATEARYKADRLGHSFLFSVRSPGGAAPRRFPLRHAEKHHAIYCTRNGGPEFGAGTTGFGDLAIRDESDRKLESSSTLGHSYAAAEADLHALAGKERFLVREVEVFQFPEHRVRS
jgi:hypothetical protein